VVYGWFVLQQDGVEVPSELPKQTKPPTLDRSAFIFVNGIVGCTWSAQFGVPRLLDRQDG
jgi:hypothetical protein